MDGFFFRPTPGHSPDHLSISLSSQGENALFAGDIIHLPIQIDYPELSSCFGADPERGRLSRLWALEYTVANNALFFSSHCPGSSAGRVKRNSGQFQWCFV
jgi:glyoxylase-like metal-dependent hydrolase (beta-lactamase superfamily II)